MKEIKRTNDRVNELIDEYLNTPSLNPVAHELYNKINTLTNGNALAVIQGRRQALTVQKREKELKSNGG